MRQQVSDRGDAAALPPHVRAMADLWMGLASTEREWLVDLVRRVDAGDLEFAGEVARWAPPADDPGWAMAGDRARYTELIARS